LLFAPSGPLSAAGAAFVDRLSSKLGGERVEPLHVTVDRVTTKDAAGLVRAVHESVWRLRPAPIRVDRLFFLPSESRGPEVVKLEVMPDRALDSDFEALLSVLRQLGVPSLYRDDRARPTITTLQRVVRRDEVDPDLSALPLDLFVADTVIVSRITGPARYEILDTATVPTSG
jgi:hypothetical protein